MSHIIAVAVFSVAALMVPPPLGVLLCGLMWVALVGGWARRAR